jgi:hypothetical protein
VPDQTGTIASRNQVLPALVMNSSVQQYLVLVPNSYNSYPNYVLALQSTGDWSYSDASSGVYFPVAAGALYFTQVTQASSSFYVNGAGTLSVALYPLLYVSDVMGSNLIEQIPGLLESPVAKTYIILLSNDIPLEIDNMQIQTVSGTCTASLNINGTPVTGLGTISVSSAPQTLTATALNVMANGDELTLVITSPSTPQDLAFVIQTTRS